MGFAVTLSIKHENNVSGLMLDCVNTSTELFKLNVHIKLDAEHKTPKTAGRYLG
jgi:hypothetical protein